MHRAAIVEQPRRTRRGRRWPAGEPLELLEASVPTRAVDIDLANLSGADDEDDDRGGLASIGFADEDEFDDGDVYAAIVEEPDEIEDLDDDPEPPTLLDRSPRLVGHRVEGWVRPEYRDFQRGEAGDYWTPLPSAGGPEANQRDEDDPEPSARGYGWPVQVERLPPVPSYEPATGFDLKPVPAEPTELVPAWSSGDNEHPERIRLPRSWSAGEEKAYDERAFDERAFEERAFDERWPGRDEKPRPRPRPRPRPATPVDRDGMYVSRHAADPPR